MTVKQIQLTLSPEAFGVLRILVQFHDDNDKPDEWYSADGFAELAGHVEAIGKRIDVYNNLLASGNVKFDKE